jgi:hypothetical protein
MMTSLQVHTHCSTWDLLPPHFEAVLSLCLRHWMIWLPDLGNMLLVGFASFEQAAGRVGRVIDTLQLYLRSFLPLRWGAGPMALMLWLNLVI